MKPEDFDEDFNFKKKRTSDVLFILKIIGIMFIVFIIFSSSLSIKKLAGSDSEIEEKGEKYIQTNFKYSILEIFDTKTKQEYILERENYWKNVFETKKFGMNRN